MTMPAKEAAKVLRRHNEWRRGADDNHWQQSPYSPAELGNAIDAAVAALEHQPKPAYCCAKCGLAEMHPRERALHQDAKRGNFRQEDDGA